MASVALINSMNSTKFILSKRIFDLKNQYEFAKFSGDCNPIHVEPLFARRTTVGKCIVHGLHAVLWALDSYLVHINSYFSKIDVNFLKPILLDEEIVCSWDQDKQQILISNEDMVLVRIKTVRGNNSAKESISIANNIPGRYPSYKSFADCANQVNIPFVPHGESDGLRSIFPQVANTYGMQALSDLVELSYVVGMECPGLQSLFGGFCISFCENEGEDAKYSVINSDPRFSSLEIGVKAKSFFGNVLAFYRPPPPKNPSMMSIANYVSKGEFSNVSALIIGGSRGLGELVAKIVGVGGGRSIVTYSSGKEDAANVVAEIVAYGSHSDSFQFTASRKSTLPFDSLQFNQVYYFATPKILGKSNATHDAKQYEAYCEVYVEAFESISRQLAVFLPNCKIFFPSTVFIDEPQKGFELYVDAKRKGELMCMKLNSELNLKIHAHRLPKLNTDQTQTLFSENYSDGVDVLLKVVREMSEEF